MISFFDAILLIILFISIFAVSLFAIYMIYNEYLLQAAIKYTIQNHFINVKLQ
jgi:hypothetical protein